MNETIPYVPAKYQGPVRKTESIDFLVVHTMEAPEKGNTAEAVANYFANIDRVASAHLCVDADSIVECVRPDRVAYAAGGGNAKGYHYELAGYSYQSGAQWADPYSVATVFRVAEHMARMSLLLNIPVVFLTPEDLRAGKRGITTHAAITAAFRKSTHTDPGGSFPMSDLLKLVSAIRDQLLDKAPAPAEQELPPAQATPPAYTRPTLSVGAVGNSVKNLQLELLFLTGQPKAVDGIFGDATREAVANFQRFFNLKQDPSGVAGRQTWFMLDCMVVSNGGSLVLL